MSRHLVIVNADDLGLSRGVNMGIAEAHERGIVTSASLMTGRPGAAEAAEYARAHPRLGVGLHVDLGEWAWHDGAWVALGSVVPDDAVEAAVAGQVRRFRELMRRDPTHLDSHQHVHRSAPARTVLTACARQLGVPLRDVAGGVRYRGDFYGQDSKGAPLPDAITVEALIRLLESVQDGITEIGCHPGYAIDVDGMYREERAAEVRVLCDPRVRRAVERAGIRLVSFAEIPRRT